MQTWTSLIDRRKEFCTKIGGVVNLWRCSRSATSPVEVKNTELREMFQYIGKLQNVETFKKEVLLSSVEV